MQRTFSFFTALLSLVMVGLCPALAQNTFKEVPVQPSGTPQEIDERTGNGATLIETNPAEAVTVAANETRDNVAVKDRPLVIAGNVKHDVLAVNSDVTVKPGAKVGGTVVVIGGNIQNEAGDSVHVVRQNEGVLSALENAPSSEGNAKESRPFAVVLPDVPSALSHRTSATPPTMPSRLEHIRQSWPGSQWALLFFGLLGGLILLIAAPRAAQQCATLVGLEPARCLIIGAVGAVIGLIVSVFNVALMHSPLGLVYAPLGAVVALVPLILLACGWLCGMRCVGDLAARVLGRQDRGHGFVRLALGLGVFFVVKLILGGISPMLGGVALTVEFVVALVGVGAILISGFGKDPDWLGSRLRGQTPWFPGMHRP